MDFCHKPVLLEECINGLNIRSGGIYVDGTIGGGGHSAEIYKKLGGTGILLGMDQDQEAIKASTKKLNEINTSSEKILVNSNFKFIKNVCISNGIEGLDGALLDLGTSSYQLDNAERGFSYNYDTPLDMRMNRDNSLTAEEIVNQYDSDQLKNIISSYGEEKWASRIAEFIVKYRENRKIQTTGQLVEIIKAAIPSSARREGPHPAKRTFQALRIEVNSELEILEDAIDSFVSMLNTGGRFCIITFHSLEDRIVKRKFLQKSDPCTCPPEFPKCMCGNIAIAKIITKKPISPSQDELSSNPRARSAKLRILERL